MSLEATRKVCLITGASAGIGAAVAREAARRHHDVMLTARRADRLERLADALRESHPGLRVAWHAADLDTPEAPDQLVQATLDAMGRFDVLINNAGMGLPTLFADGVPADLRRQLSVNLVAPLMLTRAALPVLIERRGMVINVGSAITSVPNPALGAYGATKAGLAYWNDALRRELRHTGVRVCLVEPGPVRTEFFDALVSLAPRPGGYHPMLDAPAPWMTARVEEVARRIVRLIDHPRRRLSVMRRFVWPWRMAGMVFRLFPILGDVGVSSILRYHERKGPPRRSRADSR
ncbi:MAG: SDR family NAD(P)-dependent oxidoreductase [Isosphaeraceae bacterium]